MAKPRHPVRNGATDSIDPPEGWAPMKLEDCVEILDSLRVPVNSTEREKRRGDVPYYGATGQVGWIDDFLFDEELVLIGEDGAPFLDKSKPIAYIIRGKSWVNNHAHVLRAISTLTSNKLIKYQLDNLDFTEHVNGTTRLKLTQSAMRFLPILLPPVAEQKRIVAKIDALMARVNAARERLAKVPAILKRFRQSVLAAACSGRLTEDWRESHPCVEPGPALLHRLRQDWLKSHNTGKSRNRDIPSNFCEPLKDLDLWQLPDTWCFSECGLISDPDRAFTYGVIKLGPPQPGGVPTLRSSDVRWLRIDESGIKRISIRVAEQYSRTFLSGGEIVLTVRGTLGGVAVVPFHMKGYNVSREVAVFPIIGGLEPTFFAYSIADMRASQWLGEVLKGEVYTGINIRDLKGLPLPIPPLNEQREIIRRVEALFKLADAIEKRVTTATARADKLTQSILAKAFRGELVPTEADLAHRERREYEPASVLLERIRSEMAGRAVRKGERKGCASAAVLS
jgi:type I restriction enzyme S subunit